MGRTQVYLGKDELELLDRASRETGASRSELIRRAVRNTFGERGREDRLHALRASAGAWGERQAAGSDYVEQLRRSDLDQRLSELGLK